MKGLLNIISKSEVQGTVDETKPLGAGLTNDAYKVNTTEIDAPDCVLQYISHAVFQNMEMLQDNIATVTEHIRRKLTKAGEIDIDRKVLTSLPTEEGKTYWFDGDSYWYVMVFIPRAKTYETVSPEYPYYAGAAFGDFQAILANIPTILGETVPDFHNMEFRLKQPCKAVATGAIGRIAEVQYYLDKIEKRAGEMCKVERLYRKGKLPERVCHCGTKMNNVMFDEDGKVFCIVDLGTVMPNFIFSDHGDFLRTGINTGDEDGENLDNVNFNIETFKAFTKGYLKGTGSFLTPIEIEDLPYAVILFPYMQCVRFLADYIDGDTYYKIKYPEHDLARIKVQFKLLQDIEEHTPEMEAYIKECLG